MHTHDGWSWAACRKTLGALSSPDTRGKLALGSVFSSTRPLRKKKGNLNLPTLSAREQRTAPDLLSPHPRPFHPGSPLNLGDPHHFGCGAFCGARGDPLRQPGSPAHPAQLERICSEPTQIPLPRGKLPPPPQTAQVWPVQIRSRRGGDGAGGGFPPTLVVAFTPRVCASFSSPRPSRAGGCGVPRKIPAHGRLYPPGTCRGRKAFIKDCSLNAISNLTGARSSSFILVFWDRGYEEGRKNLQKVPRSHPEYLCFCSDLH